MANERIVVSGASGFIGGAICTLLGENGKQIIRLVRDRKAAGLDRVYWDPLRGELELGRLEGVSAIVNLAGESIAARWTEAKKRAVRDSRICGTRLLAKAANTLKPAVFLSASAVGYYGDRGAEELDESAPAGAGFLAGVCRDWEAAAREAEGDTRVVLARFGLVLSRSGGALARMLPFFKLGLGGPLGSGRQYASWISLADAAAVLLFLLERRDLSGPVNAVSPRAITNREFAETLGAVLHRPALMPAPATMLRLRYGEMANELLLSSARVKPERLMKAGYQFKYPELREALGH